MDIQQKDLPSLLCRLKAGFGSVLTTPYKPLNFQIIWFPDIPAQCEKTLNKLISIIYTDYQYMNLSFNYLLTVFFISYSIFTLKDQSETPEKTFRKRTAGFNKSFIFVVLEINADINSCRKIRVKDYGSVRGLMKDCLWLFDAGYRRIAEAVPGLLNSWTAISHTGIQPTKLLW